MKANNRPSITATQLGAIAYASGLLATTLNRMEETLPESVAADIEAASRMLTGALRGPGYAAHECRTYWNNNDAPFI